ncbi:MAG: Rha family transcriptional regulator, partial [Pseudomonadota bacterium]
MTSRASSSCPALQGYACGSIAVTAGLSEHHAVPFSQQVPNDIHIAAEHEGYGDRRGTTDQARSGNIPTASPSPSLGTDLVFEQDGEATTDSLIIAEYFGKRPGDVMRVIREIAEDLPEISQRTFALSDYVDVRGKIQPKYVMNRDGAMLITNTFKGKKARQKQWQFIQLFNAMELRASSASRRTVMATSALAVWSATCCRTCACSSLSWLFSSTVLSNAISRSLLNFAALGLLLKP